MGSFKKDEHYFNCLYKTELLLHPWTVKSIEPLNHYISEYISRDKNGNESGTCYSAKLSVLHNKPTIVCIDGLISSGKSTILKKLEKRGFLTYPEPLSDWEDQLKNFYANPRKEFINTQSLILKSQTGLKEKIIIKSKKLCSTNNIQEDKCVLDNIDKKKYIFIERNCISQLYFMYTGFDLKNVSSEEAIIFFNFWKKVVWLPDIIVHMNTPPSICFERIKKRSQVGDSGVSLEYLNLLHKNYRGIYSQMEDNTFYRCIKLCKDDTPDSSVKRLLYKLEKICL